MNMRSLLLTLLVFACHFVLFAQASNCTCPVSGSVYYCSADGTSYQWCAIGINFGIVNCPAGTECLCGATVDSPCTNVGQSGPMSCEGAPGSCASMPPPAPVAPPPVAPPTTPPPTPTSPSCACPGSGDQAFYCTADGTGYQWCANGFNFGVVLCSSGTECRCGSTTGSPCALPSSPDPEGCTGEEGTCGASSPITPPPPTAPPPTPTAAPVTPVTPVPPPPMAGSPMCTCPANGGQAFFCSSDGGGYQWCAGGQNLGFLQCPHGTSCGCGSTDQSPCTSMVPPSTCYGSAGSCTPPSPPAPVAPTTPVAPTPTAPTAPTTPAPPTAPPPTSPPVGAPSCSCPVNTTTYLCNSDGSGYSWCSDGSNVGFFQCPMGTTCKCGSTAETPCQNPMDAPPADCSGSPGDCGVGSPAPPPPPAPVMPPLPAPFAINDSVMACSYPMLSSGARSAYLPAMNAAITQWGIDSTILSVAAFMGQIGHESLQLTEWRELCHSTMSCPDYVCSDPGDWCEYLGITANSSVEYYGRGPIQLTWDGNYYQAGIHPDIDEDLLNYPDLVASDPSIGFATAGWFWDINSINGPADSGNFAGTTQLINGALECNMGPGAASQNSRVENYNRVRMCLGLAEETNPALLYC